ncbi:MAG: aminotransferase class III-fold pyridoxal phosphate-dependent enzyme [Limisphaerales bacterium]
MRSRPRWIGKSARTSPPVTAERGTEILHFESAFHGRSGYTMSLTNTDPKKVAYFAKFPWPRVSTPFIDFSLPEPQRTENVAAKEKVSEKQIRDVIAQKGVDIAAIIIEPIQGEGGDHHFRQEWFQTLRKICDENDILLIFDEVQTGMGLTGKGWCCEHFGVMPDLICFGKKAQVCGIMAGPRLDEVKDNVFRLPSRINSTLGREFYRLRPLQTFSQNHRAGETGGKRPRQRRLFHHGIIRDGKTAWHDQRRARSRPDDGVRPADRRDARCVLEKILRAWPVGRALRRTLHPPAPRAGRKR